MNFLELMFNEIKYIQNSIINNVLYNDTKKNDIIQDEFIADTINETIYRIMEFFDGYSNIKIRYLIKNINSGIIINDNIFDLHDKWYNYVYNYTSKAINIDIDSLFIDCKNVKNDIFNFMIKNKEKYNNNFLAMILSLTSKTIYSIFLVIDGYNTNMVKYNIIDSQNNIVLNDNKTMLHINILNYLL